MFGIPKERMRFTVAELLRYITALGLWLGLIGSGDYLFGTYGAVSFGVFFGFAALFSLGAIRRWGRWSVSERAMSATAIVVSIAAGLYMAKTGFDIRSFARPALSECCSQLRRSI